MTPFEKEEGPESQSHFDKLQKAAASKQTKRVRSMGGLMRSKGFIWIATSNFIMGGLQQAGNMLRIEAEGPWMCEIRDMWEGTPSEPLVLKDLNQENGEEWPHADRRQELVFIGKDLNHEVIQYLLDQCLLNNEEMEMGPEKWKESMEAVDKIKLSLEPDEDDDEDEDGEEEEEEEVQEDESN